MKLDEWGHRKNKKASHRRTPNISQPLLDSNVSGLGLDPAVSPSAFTSGRFTFNTPHAGPAPNPRPSPIPPPSPQSQDDSFELRTETSEALQVPATSNGEKRGLTPLHNAVLNREIETVRSILSVVASCEDRDHFGDTPLHYAYVQAGENPDQPMVLEIARLLLDHGADLLAENQVGASPLHRWATSATLLRLALPGCSNIDIQNKSGETPLHCAIKSSLTTGSPTAEAVSMLIEAGANVYLPNQTWETPLDLAVDPTYRCWYRNPSDITLFLERALQVRSKLPWVQLNFPLGMVLANPVIENLLRSETGLGSWVKLIHTFISCNVNPNRPLHSGERLINVCFRRLGLLSETSGSPQTHVLIREMQGLIFELCGKVNLKASEQDGTTLLHQAAWNLPFHPTLPASFPCELLQLLVQRGVDPNAVNNAVGATPLALLLQRDHSDVPAYVTAVRSLLDMGANVLRPNNSGDRPFYVAVQSMKPSAMRDTVLQSCLVSLVEDIEKISLDESPTLPDTGWWASWRKTCYLSLWKEGTSLLSKMPKEISLSPRKKTELKALAITVLADRCFRSITLAGAVDSDFFSRSEDRRLFTMGKRVYRKPIILDIIRVAQIYGVEIKQGWREMAQSLEREEDETSGARPGFSSRP
jgi:ankyrin repeat protein